MKKLIHKYLNEYFRIEKGKVHKNQKYNTFDISSYVVIKELSLIFALEKNDLKWYVKSWVKKQSKSFAFNSWWTPVYKRFEFLFPIAERIAARTIAADLVELRPMNPPTYRHIGGMDAGYIYAPYIPEIVTAAVELDHHTPDRLTARYAAREVNPNYYAEININEETRQEQTIRRWQEAGFLNNLDETQQRPRVDPETGHIDLPYNQILIEQDFSI